MRTGPGVPPGAGVAPSSEVAGAGVLARPGGRGARGATSGWPDAAGTDAAGTDAADTDAAGTSAAGTSAADTDERRSRASERARAFVAGHRASAEALGRRIGELAGDPDGLAVAAGAGLETLADPAYVDGAHLVAPGIGAIHGVRWPFLAAVGRGLRASTRRDGSAQLLLVADRLLRAPTLEERWLAFGILERVLPRDPERSWQLLRQAAREAGDWITVDTLAHPYGRGILFEAYRWAEIEQLVYSPSRWERRLVGSTIATIPFVDRRLGREATVAARALPIVGDLIGDDAAEVRKALSWALRSLTLVDAAAVLAFCEREADVAREAADGHRAWVVREVLPKLDTADAARLRSVLEGIRRRRGALSTSRAAATAVAFTAPRSPEPLARPATAADVSRHQETPRP